MLGRWQAITTLDAIPKLVHLLTSGAHESRRHAASALYQLATTADNKTAIVQAKGIPVLVELLCEEGMIPDAKEAAAAVLSELASVPCEQSAHHP